MGKTFGQSSSDLQIICTITPWMVLHLVNNNNDSFIYPLFKIITLANYYVTIMRHVNKTSWKLQSNRMFFWWELCKLPPQHWYLIDRSSWENCFCAVFKNHLISSLQSKFLLWLMMPNIHYNRTTTLEKREKIIDLWTSQWSGQFKTGSKHRRSLIIASNGI